MFIAEQLFASLLCLFHDRSIIQLKMNMLLGNFCTYSKLYIWTGMNFEDSLHYVSCAGNSQQPYVLYILLPFC